MQEPNNKANTGKIKTFNEQFGFITSELGETFFHKTSLEHDYVPQKNDEVEFQLRPSKQKFNMFDACNIVLIKRGEKLDRKATDEKYLFGIVKWFDSINGFGFISADKTDYFIHGSNLLSTTFITEGDTVIFFKKLHNGKLSAIKCQPFVVGLNNCTSESQIELLKKYVLNISSKHSSRYDTINSIAQSDRIEESVKNVFLQDVFDKAGAEFQCKMLIDGLIILSEESQTELLQKYVVNISSKNSSRYDAINSIAQSDRIEESVKNVFLQDVFDKASAEFQCKMLIDGLIILSEEIQTELLQKYVFDLVSIDNSSYILIKSVFQSDKIGETIKEAFLKSVFEKASAEFQFKMLIDGLTIISGERQTALLQHFGRSHIDTIKSIAQSEKIEGSVKNVFLQSVFEKASAEFQCKMLIDGLIILSEERQTELLRKQLFFLYGINNSNYGTIKSIAQSDKIEETVKDAFIKTVFENSEAEFQYKMLLVYNLIHIQKETTERQIDQLEHYWKTLCTIDTKRTNKFSSNEHKFDKIKSITQSDRIGEIVKEAFLKSVFEKASAEFQYKILFDDNCNSIFKLHFDLLVYIENYKLLGCVKKYNSEFYNTLFEQNYPQISKIDRLRLWLNNLNPYYYYLELVQSAWQLSNDERKLLNKRIKEHAIDERLQIFIEQIPLAKLTEKTESTKTYKCKWRNLYYKNGAIQVFIDKKIALEDYKWDVAREEWNLLTQEYFNNRRLDDIIVTVNNYNYITEITGLEDIEVQIVIAEVRKNGTTDRKINISSSQTLKIIHNIAARNECINFLATQNSNHNVLDIQELVTEDYGSLHRDISFIFPISDGNGNVYLIWESADFEKSKRTHIFKCSEEELEDMESKIKNFIESNLRTRSRLNSKENEDHEEKRKLKYFCGINHDSVEYQVWENRMKDALPFLK
ncbi:MAG: cold shock domain-containing protein [Candidatus Methylacidiphilales bacterium]